MSRFPISWPARAAIATAGLLALVWAAPAQQGPVISARPGQRATRPFPAPVDGAIRLSLDDAIGLALANNQDLNVTVSAAEASSYNLIASKGIFDPVLEAFINRQHAEARASSELAGSAVNRQDTFSFGGQVTQLAPTGGTFSLGTNAVRTSTNSRFFFINPSYDTGLTLTMSQPLLRNFGPKTTTWLIRISENARDASYQQFLRSVQTAVNSVEQAYWDLAYAIRNLEVTRESLRIAQDLNRITKIRIDVGSLAPIDITQTEVGIAEAEQDIITAEGLIGDAQDRLRRLLNIEPATVNVPILPTDEVRAEPATIQVEEGMRAAIVRRPEVVAQAYAAESDRIRYAYWSNQTLPGLNLVGSYGNTGTAGTIVDPQGNIIEQDHFGGAYRQVIDRDFKNWSIGLNFSYPILNRFAKGQRGAARYNLESSRALLTTKQQDVIVEVRAAARAIETSRRQIAAAAKGRELAERNLDAEKKKFDNGMTTSFQVNQIQRDLFAARTTELQALVVYRKALAAYHYAVADILDWKGIGVEGIPEAAPPPLESSITAASAK